MKTKKTTKKPQDPSMHTHMSNIQRTLVSDTEEERGKSKK